MRTYLFKKIIKKEKEVYSSFFLLEKINLMKNSPTMIKTMSPIIQKIVF